VLTNLIVNLTMKKSYFLWSLMGLLTLQLDWNTVLQKTQAADVNFDLSPIGDICNSWDYACRLHNNAGWIRVDQK
jgi:hypothetical protein